MISNDSAQQLYSFFNIWTIKFFQLFNENIKHGNSDFSLFSFKSVDVIKIFLGLFFVIGIGNWVIDKLEFCTDNIFNQNEQRWQNPVEVWRKLFPIDKTQSLPSCQYVCLLRISLFETWLLHVDHQINEFLGNWFEHLASNRTGYDSKSFNGLTFKLFVFFWGIFLILEEAEH